MRDVRDTDGVRTNVAGAAVRVEGLTFSYGAGEVLHGIGFTLHAGEVVGLLGPNGAGKSTTIKILAGHPAAGGRGGPGRRTRDAVRGGRGQAAHRVRAGGRRTLREPHRPGVPGADGPPAGRARASPAVPHRAVPGAVRPGRRPAAAPGGLLQGDAAEVLLSAALLHDPDVVLLDEPLSGLDVNAGIMVRDLIAALAAQGKAILYSSHVLDVDERVCDRALIIHEGRLVADGSLESLKAATERGSLEDVFRQLTDTEGAAAEVSEIIEALRS